MAEFTAAGLLRVGDPAQKVYDRHGVAVTLRCVTSREGAQSSPTTDASVSIKKASTTVAFGHVNMVRGEPDPAHPGDYMGTGFGRYEWVVWSTDTAAAFVSLDAQIVDGVLRWAVLEQADVLTIAAGAIKK